MNQLSPLEMKEQPIIYLHPLKINVLIIDSETEFQSELSGFLRDRGHLAMEAVTAAEGLELLDNKKFDLLFLDFDLPDRKGLALLIEIKAKFPCLEIITVYKHRDINILKRSIMLGALDYLEKPLREFDIQIVMERAEKFLNIHKKIDEAENSNLIFKTNLEELLHNK